MRKLTIRDVENLGSDSLEVFGGSHEGGYRLQQIPDEIVPCVNYIIDTGAEINTLLEIGSASGANAALFDAVFSLQKTVIVDDNHHKQHVLRPDVIKHMQSDVTECIGDAGSGKVFDSVCNVGVFYDIIFLDADCSRDHVFAYLVMLSPGGFFAIHDIEIFPHRWELFNELKTYFANSLTFVSTTHQRPCGIGLLH